MCTRRSCKLSSIDAEKCFSACPQSESVSNCAIQRFAFQIHCMSNRVYTVYPIVYTRCVYPIAKRKHYAANINCTICHIAQICTFTQFYCTCFSVKYIYNCSSVFIQFVHVSNCILSVCLIGPAPAAR